LPIHTKEIICREVICIPDLQVEPGWDLGLRLVPGEQSLLPRDDDLLLSNQVLKWEDEPPVEVAFTSE